MSLASGDLTTLAAAKAYIDVAPSDQVLSGLIVRMSRYVLTYLNRATIVPKTYSDVFNGTNTRQLVLPNWPILPLTAAAPITLSVSGASMQLAPQETDQNTVALPYGYRLPVWNGVPPGDPAVVELVGGAFYLRGAQNIVVGYRAGYRVTDEAQTIPVAPGPFQITPTAPYGSWATDEGVTFSNGTALTAVPYGSTPLTGQYIPPDPGLSVPRNYYTFAAADQGLDVLISYGFVPADLEQVCIELIAERASYRKRIGLRSQVLASQETLTYDLSGLPPYARAMLQPYVSVLPPALGADV